MPAPYRTPPVPPRAARAAAAGCLAACLAAAGCASPGAADDDVADDDTTPDDNSGTGFQGRAVDRVDPFVGTGGMGFGVGSAFPGPSAPFGMVRPGPDSSSDFGAPGFYHCSGYWYEDTHLDGFSQVRLHGIGVADLGAVLLMPTSGMDGAKTDEEGWRSPYSHETEEARPGYYAVTLDDTGIRVELSATVRAGIHRYTFPAGLDPVVIVDPSHALGENSCPSARVDLGAEDGVVEGWTLHQGGLAGRGDGVVVYYSLRFDPPPASSGTWTEGVLAEGSASAEGGDDVGAWLRFDLPEGGEVAVEVGISFRGVEAARGNREAEVAGQSLDEVAAATLAAWEEALRVVEVEGGTHEEQGIFYSALYHSMLMPDVLTDADGSYRGFDGEDHAAEGFVYHSNMSLWDTYRTQHPLLALLAPGRQRDAVISLVKMYEQGGALPRWPAGTADSGSMVGESATIVIAESYLKGIVDFDVETAWEGMVAGADGTLPPEVGYGGRPGLEGYVERGWCAADEVGGATSVTMEYANDDHALSLLAEALGRDEDAARYRERSQGWRGLFDPETGFLEGRYADGTWARRGSDAAWEDWYTEANAWQTVWSVPFDPPGLIEAMGGEDAFVARLSEFFDLSAQQADTALFDPYYWHGNEPDIHAPWLFVEAGRPDLAQRWVRWVMDGKYRLAPDGLDGNDDGGTLSAWYVFAALGLYPVAGTDRYWVGAPRFPRATLHLAGGDLVIDAPGAGAEAPYVAAATLDGEPLAGPWLTHDRIAAGGVLAFDLSGAPTDWGR